MLLIKIFKQVGFVFLTAVLVKTEIVWICRSVIF